MANIKNIWKPSFTALCIAVLSVFTAEAVDAKTVTASNTFIDQSAYLYFNDVYEREEYKYGFITSEYIPNSAYNYTSYYYLCLTNDKPDVSNSTNVTSSCDKLVRYYRNRDTNSYVGEVLTDKELKVDNTLYYYFNTKNYFVESTLFIIGILLCIFVVFAIFIVIFR